MRSVPVFFPPQHPVDSLALIGPENRNKSLVLDIIGYFLALFLVQMSDIIIELLHILPLQVSVTFFLLILYNFYMEKTAAKYFLSRQDERGDCL